MIIRGIFFLLIFAVLPFSSIAKYKKYDVVAVGEAMVDIMAEVSEEELEQLKDFGVRKSDTSRINLETAKTILSNLKNYKIIPGGSEANVIASLASLGGKTAFNTIVADDQYGVLFKQSLEKEKVHYLSKLNKDPGKKTALCITLITPDKERTFAVFGDITGEIDDHYIDYEAIKDSKIFYTDASDLDNGKNKSRVTQKAFKVAKNNQVKVAFNLNNNFFIEKNRNEIINLLPQIDILIGGRSEAKNLFQVQTTQQIINKSLEYAKILVLTCGAEGTIIATKDYYTHIPSVVKKAKIVDLNGAGDGYVAGFLYGYTHGYNLQKSGEIGARAAAEIIYQHGGRPQTSLSYAIYDNKLKY